MKLAEQLSCPVYEAKARVSHWELTHWIAYWDLKREAEELSAEGKKPRAIAEEMTKREAARQKRLASKGRGGK